MKKIVISTISMIMSVLCIFSSSSCNAQAIETVSTDNAAIIETAASTSFQEQTAISTITEQKPSINLILLQGEKYKINMLEFTSSNDKIASIKNGNLVANNIGKTIIIGKEYDINLTVECQKVIFSTKMRDSYTIPKFKAVLQMPELPTGCEITALTQTLNYYGYNVSKTYMADRYLVKAAMGTTTFDKAFMSNPKNYSSYGCYSPVIVSSVNHYFNNNDNNHVALNMSGNSAENLYKMVNEGYPVIVWGTMNMSAPKQKYLWTVNGQKVYWQSGEHCLTLIGYDKIKGTVTLADPLKGITTYNMKTFEARYNTLGKQAVVIKSLNKQS